jgi:hypothetical protein
VKFKILFALLPLLSLSVSQAANPNPAGGTWTNVTVVGMTACTAARCPPQGWIVVEVSANAAGSPPACARDNPRSIAIDVETKAGAFAAAILQSAALSGMPITIVGAGTCGVDAAIESVAKVTELTSRNR